MTRETLNKIREWVLIVFVLINSVLLIEKLTSPANIQLVMPSQLIINTTQPTQQCSCDTDDNDTNN